MLGKLGFVRLDYGDYGRRMVKEVRVEIHGLIFFVDFVVIDYANEGEPFVVFKRDFLVTTKCKDMDEVRSTSGELVKIGKASLRLSTKHNLLSSSCDLLPSCDLVTSGPIFSYCS
ncbi:hypothetical protein Tco_0752912 [Tanacetum coccineum]